MINTKELRIGNWVYVEKPNRNYHTSNYVQAEEVLEDGINRSMGDEATYTSKEIEPIWVDNEILDTAGFEELQGTVYEDFEVERYKKGPVGVSIASMGVYNIEVYGNRIYYGPNYALHQLQNLWYAIHGAELKINL